MTVPWRGVFPAMTTQFRRDESLDLDATGRHIETMIDSGAEGVVMLGSLGENAALRARREVAGRRDGARSRGAARAGDRDRRRDEHRGRAAVRARHGAPRRRRPDAAARDDLPRRRARSDAALPDVARATQLPIICYNNPLAYNVDITPAMFAGLAEVPNFVAIKESSGDVRRITDLRNTVGDRYVLFAGVDDLVLESAALGIDGWIAGIGLAIPAENQRLWDLAAAGEIGAARALYRWFTPLAHLDTHVKFVQYIKLAIQVAGLGSEWVRAPRRPLIGEERRRILKVIETGLANRPTLPPAPGRGTRAQRGRRPRRREATRG